MLDRPVEPVRGGELIGLLGRDPAALGERCERGERRRQPQRGVAAAMDQLVDLREKFAFANAAAAALEVIAWAKRLTLRIMVTNPRRDRAHFANRAKIKPAPPDKGPDRVEKAIAEREVARARARADERSAFPGERRRFIIGYRSLDR